MTFRLVVAPLRGPGQSLVLPFACCVGSLLSVGRCGRCSCWCPFRVRGAQWLVCRGRAGCAPPPPAERCSSRPFGMFSSQMVHGAEKSACTCVYACLAWTTTAKNDQNFLGREENCCAGGGGTEAHLPNPGGSLCYCTCAQEAISTKSAGRKWLVSGLEDHRYLSVYVGEIFFVKKNFPGQNLCSGAFGGNIRPYSKQRARHRSPFLEPPPLSFAGRPCHSPPPRKAIFGPPCFGRICLTCVPPAMAQEKCF